MSRRKNIVISLLLLTLFVTYQASISMFSHVHYVNGVMLVHSHPTGENQHTHTEGQILTMAHVSSFVGTEPIFVVVGEVFLPVLYLLNGSHESRSLAESCAHSISLRAPPFYC